MEITETEFNDRVAKGGRFVADFFATWCGPCRAFAPIFEEAASKATACDFVKIDVDKCPDVAERYGIRSVPTIIVFDKGKVVATLIGTFGSAAEILKFIS